MAYWSIRPHEDFVSPVKDDVDSFLFYATAGLLDPTNVLDVPVHKASGLSTAKSFGLAAARGFFVTGAIGWFIDPLHLREGGFDQTSMYRDMHLDWHDPVDRFMW